MTDTTGEEFAPGAHVQRRYPVRTREAPATGVVVKLIDPDTDGSGIPLAFQDRRPRARVRWLKSGYLSTVPLKDLVGARGKPEGKEQNAQPN